MREFDGTAQEQRSAHPGLSPARAEAPGSPSLVAQRLASPEAVLDLQQSGGNAAAVQLLSAQRDADQEEGAGQSPVLDIVGRGGGQPLDESLRAGMENALGADLGDVRVHSDGAAAASARSVQAHAYTVGNEVVFGAGQYQPDTPAGQRVLAHELTHVVQQRSGPVDGTPTGDGIAVSDPSDRFERAAEANADRIMAEGSLAGATPAPGGGSGSGAVAQREAAPEDEEEPVQGMWVQREDAPEEEMETS